MTTELGDRVGISLGGTRFWVAIVHIKEVHGLRSTRPRGLAISKMLAKSHAVQQPTSCAMTCQSGPNSCWDTFILLTGPILGLIRSFFCQNALP